MTTNFALLGRNKETAKEKRQKRWIEIAKNRIAENIAEESKKAAEEKEKRKLSKKERAEEFARDKKAKERAEHLKAQSDLEKAKCNVFRDC